MSVADAERDPFTGALALFILDLVAGIALAALLLLIRRWTGMSTPVAVVLGFVVYAVMCTLLGMSFGSFRAQEGLHTEPRKTKIRWALLSLSIGLGIPLGAYVVLAVVFLGIFQVHLA